MIAGLCAFGLRPRATLEIPSPTRRLDRILELVSACRYSFHDLSRVQLAGGVPRFNMPFEVGLAVATARWRPAHQWFLLAARAYRIQRTLSDLGGTDAYIHGDALVRAAKQPTFDELYRMFRILSAEATRIRRNYGTLFGARAFRELVVVAVDFATREGARVRAAFIYGSIAKGEDTASSDIDLMVVSDRLAYADLFAALEKASTELGRKIAPTIYSSKEFTARVKQGNAFVKRVLAQPKLWLIGNDGALAT